jgi:ABC-type Fe3+-hydroxamate transport system substrate-binding protein
VLKRLGAEARAFAEGFGYPYGIAFYPPGPEPRWVYVAETGRVVRFPYRNGDLEARGAAETLLAELTPLLARVRAAVQGRPAVPVFYAIWREPYMTVGPDTYVHDVLTVCGAANVFADAATRYPAVSLDDLASRRPSVILLPDEPFRFRAVHRRDFEGYRDVPAVRDGRVLLVDGKPFTWHGPRLADALRTLPALFHPDLERASA